MATFLDCLKLDEDVKSWRCSVTSSINDAASFVSAMEEPEEDWLRQLPPPVEVLTHKRTVSAPCGPLDLYRPVPASPLRWTASYDRRPSIAFSATTNATEDINTATDSTAPTSPSPSSRSDFHDKHIRSLSQSTLPTRFISRRWSSVSPPRLSNCDWRHALLEEAIVSLPAPPPNSFTQSHSLQLSLDKVLESDNLSVIPPLTPQNEDQAFDLPIKRNKRSKRIRDATPPPLLPPRRSSCVNTTTTTPPLPSSASFPISPLAGPSYPPQPSTSHLDSYPDLETHPTALSLGKGLTNVPPPSRSKRVRRLSLGSALSVLASPSPTRSTAASMALVASSTTSSRTSTEEVGQIGVAKNGGPLSAEVLELKVAIERHEAEERKRWEAIRSGWRDVGAEGEGEEEVLA